MIRQLQFLVTSPIVFILSWEVAIVFGVQYLVFTTLALVFEQRYQFSPGSAGLTYLGDGIGAIAGKFLNVLPSNGETVVSIQLNQRLHDIADDKS